MGILLDGVAATDCNRWTARRLLLDRGVTRGAPAMSHGTSPVRTRRKAGAGRCGYHVPWIVCDGFMDLDRSLRASPTGTIRSRHSERRESTNLPAKALRSGPDVDGR